MKFHSKTWTLFLLLFWLSITVFGLMATNFSEWARSANLRSIRPISYHRFFSVLSTSKQSEASLSQVDSTMTYLPVSRVNACSSRTSFTTWFPQMEQHHRSLHLWGDTNVVLEPQSRTLSAAACQIAPTVLLVPTRSEQSLIIRPLCQRTSWIVSTLRS